MKEHVFLIGQPRVGKSTLLQKVVGDYRGRVGGFVTTEIVEGDRRVGFNVNLMNGRAMRLAHVDLQSEVRVGRYGVDVRIIDQVLPQAIDLGLCYYDVVVIDEVASMQLASQAFCAAVGRALASRKVVIATMHTDYHPYSSSLKGRSDITFIEVTERSRDEVERGLAQRLHTILG